MKNTHLLPSGLRALPPLLPTLLTTLLLLSANIADAQITTTMTYTTDNRKGYAMCAVPGTDGFVMAGTVYPIPADTRKCFIHFMHVSATGVPLHAMRFDVLDTDERAVDIDAIGPDDFLITTLLREPNYTGVTPAVPRDWVRMIRVRADGTVLDERKIGPGTGAGMPTGFMNMYPTSTVVVGTSAYIAGYCTRQPTAYSKAPLWGGTDRDKRGFILRYDLPTNALNGYMHVNTPSTSALPAGLDDYDVLLRIGVLTQQPNIGRLIVTGMCNINVGDIPNAPGVDELTCGSYAAMIQVFNTATIVDGAFVRATAHQGDSRLEAAIGWIEEAPVGGNASLYLVGNYFERYEDIANGGRWPRSSVNEGYNWWVSRVNKGDMSVAQAYSYGGLFSRAEAVTPFNSNWAVSVLPGLTPGQGDVMGMTASLLHCNTQQLASSPSNINPYLVGIAPTFDNTFGSGVGISVSYNYLSLLVTNNGTGSVSLINSLDKMGGGFANLLEGPVSATRVTATGNNEIALMASRWNSTNNVLNPKFIRTSSTGVISPCPASEPCGIGFTYTDIYPHNGPEVDVANWNSAFLPGSSTPTIPIQSDIPHPLLTAVNCSQVYRAAEGAENAAPAQAEEELMSGSVASGGHAWAWPNPVQAGYVQVSIPDRMAALDGPVQVALSDMSGRVVGVLYNGAASALTGRRLAMPAGLSTGMYLLTIAGGSESYQIRLSVQNP